MGKGKPKNLPVSVHNRLLAHAHQRHEEYQFVLIRYCLERLLYRLSRSAHRDTFVLKGAMLFALWGGEAHRPTRDLDLLGRGDNSVEALERAFRDVCAAAVEDDGVTFLPESVRGERIRAEEEYEGVRVYLEARQGSARLRLHVDVGFGDAITPRPEVVSYPTLLDFPPPELLAYPRETVVAEKYQALVMLGMANSRMKDFFDLWDLARRFGFQGPLLCQAVGATFARRKTPAPEEPSVALTAAFHDDPDKRKDWQAFLNKHKLETVGVSLEQTVGVLRDFLVPPSRAAARGEPFEAAWPPAGPWAPSAG
jgi:hypothetical protein